MLAQDYGKPLLLDDLWAIFEPLLPAEPPKPNGGRPRVLDRACLTGIIFVLKSGIPWELLPRENGVWLGRDLLAAAARLAGGGGLGPAPPGPARSPGRGRPDRFETGEPGQRQCPGKKGGTATGPNLTDRGKPGTKRHVIVDRRGIPLATRLTGANRHDSTVFEEVVDAIRPIRQPRGRPRKRPVKLHADKAYDLPRCRAALTRRRVKVRIACKGRDSSERLGRHRWVVERTLRG